MINLTYTLFTGSIRSRLLYLRDALAIDDDLIGLASDVLGTCARAAFGGASRGAAGGVAIAVTARLRVIVELHDAKDDTSYDRHCVKG